MSEIGSILCDVCGRAVADHRIEQPGSDHCAGFCGEMLPVDQLDKNGWCPTCLEADE